MEIPTCVSFFVWLATGVFIVPLLEVLKKLPKVGSIIAQLAFVLAPILAVLAPVIADLATAQCSKINPALWVVAYAGITYLFSQLTYWLGKKSGIVA